MRIESDAPPPPLRSGITQAFSLDPAVAFLNHGSFGARPRAVLEAQSRRRAEFEARPIEWLDRNRREMIQRAKARAGEFLGMTPANFGFVTNVTEGINAVLRSLEFRAGDELLTTNHVYNAVRQAMKHLAGRAGARYIESDVPLPLRSPNEVVSAIEAAITRNTRLLVLDHITSPTAVIFPVERLVRLCAERGIEVLIDGAHAPGMLPLRVESLNAAYYSANLHKWLCAPVGAGFLWVRPDLQGAIHPPTLSHFIDEGFIEEFNWQGTRDITPWLCVDDAIAFYEEVGAERIFQHNHAMATWVQRMLCERWEVQPATPLDGTMIGSMATVLLPQQMRLRERFADAAALQREINERFRIEVPVVDWGGRWWVRPCCHVYNSPEQYERLAEAVERVV